MGLKRRYKIKKQQRWERRMARKKLAAVAKTPQSPPTTQVEQAPQPQPATEDKPAGQATPSQPPQETPPTST